MKKKAAGSKGLLISDAAIVTLSGLKNADILVQDGLISRIAYHDDPNYALPSVPEGSATEVIDATGMLVFPGLVDCHVHFREPGLTHKATMASEAKAARSGGVTTVCEMPNTNPPTVTVAAFKEKVVIAEKITDCDIRFFFGITEDEHIVELQTLLKNEALRCRCAGVKLYLDHSTGNQKVEDGLLEEIFELCASVRLPIVAHCEDPKVNAAAAAANKSHEIAAHALVRPPEAEEISVGHAIDLARASGAQLHIAHLSTKGGLDRVRAAKKEKLAITCEVAPHHLFLTVRDFETLGTLAKMNPPLRTDEHVEALWEGIEDGTVDCISTDHAPHTLQEKQAEDPLKAPSGVPGVETMLPLLLTVAAGGWPHPAGGAQEPSSPLQYPDIVRLCFENPNAIFALGKLGIEEGVPVDMILVDPREEWMIGGKSLHSLCGWTPYEGWKVRGEVVRVIR